MYAEVNGINLYYETHGSRRPLILLHGGQMCRGRGRDACGTPRWRPVR